MDQEESRELGQALDLFLDEALERILFSNPVDRERIARSRLRPLLIKGSLVFQAEEQVGSPAACRLAGCEFEIGRNGGSKSHIIVKPALEFISQRRCAC